MRGLIAAWLTVAYLLFGALHGFFDLDVTSPSYQTWHAEDGLNDQRRADHIRSCEQEACYPDPSDEAMGGQHSPPRDCCYQVWLSNGLPPSSDRRSSKLTAIEPRL